MNTNYLEISIGNQQVHVTDPEELPFSIDYKLEDEEDFQKKKGSEAMQITIPATLMNSKTANSFDQVGIEDMTAGQQFKSFQPVRVKHNGYELLLGKAVLIKAEETDRPISYTFDFAADNSDWVIDLKESTLWDFMKHIVIPFTKQHIVDSWQYDGRNEQLPYVFAPIRYGQSMAEGVPNPSDATTTAKDYNMLPQYMKPSVSKYWLVYWAFKSLGYRVQSVFFDTDYFRRQTMPWTWGNFLYSDGTRLSNLYFTAKSNAEISKVVNYNDFWDLGVTEDQKDGAFDPNDVYYYNVIGKELVWNYVPAFNYGILDATFDLTTFIDATAGDDGDVVLRTFWYYNNQLINNGIHTLVELHGPNVGRRTDIGLKEDSMKIQVKPGDKVSVKFHLVTNDGGLIGRGDIRAKVEEFKLTTLSVPLNGTIQLQNYEGLKKYKFLDFLRGVIDESNIVVKTDNINKVVLMEPMHDYRLPGEIAPRKGFFYGDFLDWNNKQDLSKKTERLLFSEFEKEVIFKYKIDNNDGLQKKVQDRNAVILGSAKYVLPDRFKAGKKDYENRFFSSVIHYTVDQWESITGKAPQMIAMVPENISNTAKDEAQNTFLPKSCYYKGVASGMGWVFDGVKQSAFPFMFAVNYMAGGENDPVLSYSNERIGDVNTGKVVKGLFSRFFLQRMAIMRNGEWFNTWFKLNDYDVAGDLHREFKVCKNQRWELIAIYNYAPLKDDTTNVLLRRWVPVAIEDADNTFPSDKSVQKNISLLKYDTKYDQMKCLTTDIIK